MRAEVFALAQVSARVCAHAHTPDLFLSLSLSLPLSPFLSPCPPLYLPQACSRGVWSLSLVSLSSPFSLPLRSLSLSLPSSLLLSLPPFHARKRACLPRTCACECAHITGSGAVQKLSCCHRVQLLARARAWVHVRACACVRLHSCARAHAQISSVCVRVCAR